MEVVPAASISLLNNEAAALSVSVSSSSSWIQFAVFSAVSESASLYNFRDISTICQQTLHPQRFDLNSAGCLLKAPEAPVSASSSLSQSLVLSLWETSGKRSNPVILMYSLCS